MSEDLSMVCRCSDLDLEEIRGLIAKGYTSIDEIKRIARLGMGPCQGRTCIPLVLTELSRATGKPVAELMPATYRPLVKSVKMGAIADAAAENGDSLVTASAKGGVVW